MDYVTDLIADAVAGCTYAADRGSADRYYGRSHCPQRHSITHPEAIAAYSEAFDSETDRKDWGEF